MDAITISIDIYPPKGKQPATVNVGAAAGDGTPFLLTGTFAERHHLVDQAYGQALKQKAKAEARAAKPKPATSKAKKQSKAGSRSDSSAPAFGQPGHLASTSEAEPESDQVGPEVTDQRTQTPLVEPAADLPVIEGDEEQMELELEGSTDD